MNACTNELGPIGLGAIVFVAGMVGGIAAYCVAGWWVLREIRQRFPFLGARR